MLNKNKLCFATGILYFSIFYGVIPIRFEENDDVTMMLLVSGQYSGTPSDYLVFMNYYLARALQFLYYKFPAVEWYSALLLGIMSISFSLAIAEPFRAERGKRCFLYAVSVIISFLLFVCTVQIQFTTTAAVSAAVGVWLIAKIENFYLFLLGFVMLCLGMLVRFEAAALALIVCSPLLLLWFFQNRSHRKLALSFTACLVTGLILVFLGEQKYKNIDPEFYQYNKIRGFVNDNPLADLAENTLPDKISETDYILLQEFFVDSTVVGVKELGQISDIIRENQSQVQFTDFKKSFSRVIYMPAITAFLIFIFVYIISINSNLIRVGGIAIAILLVGILLYIATFAILKQRVVYSALAGAYFSLLFIGSPVRSRITNIALIIASLPVLFNFTQALTARVEGNKILHEKFLSQLEVLQQWDGNVVVFKDHLATQGAWLFANEIEQLGKEGLRFFGWLAGHPENNEYRRHADLLDPNVAVLIDSAEADLQSSRILRSLAENYETCASARTLVEGNNVSLIGFTADSSCSSTVP